jgi:uncharacterized DUF497 family protein
MMYKRTYKAAWMGSNGNPAKAAANLEKHKVRAVRHSHSGSNRRIISARKASPGERKRYEAR